jgi:hypothetical protein
VSEYKFNLPFHNINKTIVIKETPFQGMEIILVQDRRFVVLMVATGNILIL